MGPHRIWPADAGGELFLETFNLGLEGGDLTLELFPHLLAQDHQAKDI